jgi:thiol-disulfide isomerase/thioredoxin
MKRRTNRRAVLFALGAVWLVAAGCGSPGAGAGSSPGASLPVGVAQRYPIGQRVAPGPVKGTLLAGAAFDLAALRGRVVVVNFWGSWCAPCRAESHDLSDTYTAAKGLGVAFVGVDLRDDHDAAVAFTADFRVPYPSIFDPPGRVALAFTQVNPSVAPTTVIVDRLGKVAAVFRKGITRGELEPVVRAVAAEKVQP